MNLQRYYAEVRSIEADMPADHVLVVSLETEDGGRAGVITEVPKYEAAVMLKHKRARMLDDDEAEAFRAAATERRRVAHEEHLAERVQVTVISQDQLRKMQNRIE